MGIDPNTHKPRPRTDLNHLLDLSWLLRAAIVGNSNMMTGPWDNAMSLQAAAGAAQLAKMQLLQCLYMMPVVSTSRFGAQGGISNNSTDQENMSSSCFGDIYVQTSNQPPPAFSSAAVSPGTSSTAIFDAWEKLMDDETSESYWKD
ncbi:hypothetical protein ACFX13_023249 [Malus domestica]